MDARKFLSPHGSRVFPAPCRASLAGRDYADCCARNAAVSGKRLTKQTHAILAKIREVDAIITPELQERVREAHPEVSFKVLAGRALEHSKKRIAGRDERLRFSPNTIFASTRSPS